VRRGCGEGSRANRSSRAGHQRQTGKGFWGKGASSQFASVPIPLNSLRSHRVRLWRERDVVSPLTVPVVGRLLKRG